MGDGLTDTQDHDPVRDHILETIATKGKKAQKAITEEQMRAAFAKLVPTLHGTVLGRTSGAIKAVERSLPELVKYLNEEKG